MTRLDADGTATLTLNRPEKRNAINRALFREFREHVAQLSEDESVGLVVLRGARGNFSAGHDLKEPSHADALGWLRQELLTLELLSSLRQPVIAAVEGICYTGGLELALAADIILCDETARFADTHGKWGLVPGWGLSQRLPRRIGQAKALEMMLTSAPYYGLSAAAMGLVNECVPPGELDGKVAELAAAILANSWHSNAANKRLIYETDGMRVADGLNHELMRNAGFDPANRRSNFGKGS
ncbi:enoyl-CoA hydratase/isomerase family protein [Porphyrobacter sp. MBR-49]